VVDISTTFPLLFVYPKVQRNKKLQCQVKNSDDNRQITQYEYFHIYGFTDIDCDIDC